MVVDHLNDLGILDSFLDLDDILEPIKIISLLLGVKFNVVSEFKKKRLGIVVKLSYHITNKKINCLLKVTFGEHSRDGKLFHVDSKGRSASANGI